MNIGARLREPELAILRIRPPAGDQVPAKVSGSFVFTSSQGSGLATGKAIYGQLEFGLDIEEGYRAARLSCLNCLAAVNSAIGSRDLVEAIVQVRGFVCAVLGFRDYPAVMNGASDLLVELFGEVGRHSRSAVSVALPPKGYAVEVETVARLRSRDGK
jgi:enamine deaminase RidA (YjgF/YER057c/UK114 family)